ncbi:helix-turn-helix domain-containing protein [Streptosporangium sp. NBC_01756]|uniref:helix-turn-helix domain-containing protein n=1 Tax=Streptosporangium sp. NBC_01756 TaxID=2975950 RepID=UPI003FA3B7E8
MRGLAIAAALGCHPEIVRCRLRRFNAESIDGLGDRRGHTGVDLGCRNAPEN